MENVYPMGSILNKELLYKFFELQKEMLYKETKIAHLELELNMQKQMYQEVKQMLLK
jgi:hypothetical protein